MNFPMFYGVVGLFIMGCVIFLALIGGNNESEKNRQIRKGQITIGLIFAAVILIYSVILTL